MTPARLVVNRVPFRIALRLTGRADAGCAAIRTTEEVAWTTVT